MCISLAEYLNQGYVIQLPNYKDALPAYTAIGQIMYTETGYVLDNEPSFINLIKLRQIDNPEIYLTGHGCLNDDIYSEFNELSKDTGADLTIPEINYGMYDLDKLPKPLIKINTAALNQVVFLWTNSNGSFLNSLDKYLTKKGLL